MALTWTDNQRKIAEIILKHRDGGASGYDLKGIREELPEEEASKSTISEIAKELRELGWKIPEPQEKVVPNPPPPPKVASIEEKGNVENDVAGGMQLTEGGLTIPITLPPVVLTLFDAAKAARLVAEDKDLDSWLFECVQKRFQLDYGLQLTLVPVGDGHELKQTIRDAAKEAANQAVAQALGRDKEKVKK